MVIEGAIMTLFCAVLLLVPMQLQQMSTQKSDAADSKQIKRLENAIRELARITLSNERDTVLLGSVSRDQKGEFYKCLSCDNHPISMDDLQRNSPHALPSLGAATPQVGCGISTVPYYVIDVCALPAFV